MIAGIELERLLRKSQKLAEEVTRLNRAIAQLRRARKKQMERLLALLQKQMRQELESLKRNGPNEQARMRLEAYRREIAELRANFVQKAESSPPLPTVEELLSVTDTEQLKEHGQLLGDEQRRLEASLVGIDKQIADARAQLKLERQMADLLREQRLFGESDSMLRASGDRAMQAPEDSRTDVGGNYDGQLGGGPAEDNVQSAIDASAVLSRLERRRLQLLRRLEKVKELRRQVTARLKSISKEVPGH